MKNYVKLRFYKNQMNFLVKLKNFQNNNSSNKNILAFSLIELSIVLIIIGLLVAGVTGGASLIQSAKTRSLMNEIQNYKQGVTSYFAAKGRLPGDPTNSGEIGDLSLNDYKYDFGSDSGYGQGVYADNAPLFDLNKEGILDFDIDNKNSTLGKRSNVIKNTFYKFAYLNDANDSGISIHNYHKNLNSNVLDLNSKYDSFIPAKIAFAVDQKMDDGIYDTGNIRGNCATLIEIQDGYGINDAGGDSYKDAIDSKNGGCDEMNFKLDL